MISVNKKNHINVQNSLNIEEDLSQAKNIAHECLIDLQDKRLAYQHK